MKRVIVAIVLLVGGLSVGLGYRLSTLGAYKKAPAGGTGTVEGTEVRITARLGARVTAVLVREGDQVATAQPLVTLDCTEAEAALAEARARRDSARASEQVAVASAAAAKGSTTVARRAAQATAAEERAAQSERANVAREATRLEQLHRSGAITRSQLDQVETQRENASQRVLAVLSSFAAAQARTQVATRTEVAAAAQIEAARSVTVAAAAQVQRAELLVAECRLVAPRDGVVLLRSVEPGEVAFPGGTLLTLIELREVKVTFYLPNAELAAAAPGKAVTVRADAYPGQAFKGVIRHVSARAEFTPRNVQTREDRDRLVYGVEVTIPNADGRLRPGMPVAVTIDGTEREGV